MTLQTEILFAPNVVLHLFLGSQKEQVSGIVAAQISLVVAAGTTGAIKMPKILTRFRAFCFTPRKEIVIIALF